MKTNAILLALLFASCRQAIQQESRNCVLSTSHDNNWTTSGVVSCDSIHMHTEKHATAFIDGRAMNVYAPIIKVNCKN